MRRLGSHLFEVRDRRPQPLCHKFRSELSNRGGIFVVHASAVLMGKGRKVG